MFWLKTKSYHVSALFDLFPQYCLLATLTEQQHNKTVTKELLESVECLKVKKEANKTIQKAITSIVNGEQRVIWRQ